MTGYPSFLSQFRKCFNLFALVCVFASLVGCGGASGTKSDTTPPKTCGNFQVVLADGTCGTPPPPPPCPEGYIRENDDAACVKSDFPLPTLPSDIKDDEAIIYFNKEDKIFAGYTLYTWQGCSDSWVTPSSDWSNEDQKISAENPDPIYGAYFRIKIKPGASCGNFIVRTAGRTQQTSDLKISLTKTGSPFDRRYFIIADQSNLRNSQVSGLPICINNKCEPYKAPKLAISNIAAHWVDATTILWDREVSGVKLYAAVDGGKISANDDGSVAGGTAVADLSSTAMTQAQQTLVPHLSSYHAYAINLSVETIKSLLKKELVIVGQGNDGRSYGTRIQNSQVLDALYTAGTKDADEAKLGLTYTGSNVTTSVWAPTAQKVELRVFDKNLKIETTKTMTEDKATGIWSYTGTKAELDRKFYRFRVTGYNQYDDKTNVLEVTDPESLTLSTGGLYSQFVDLNDADLKPTGWDGHVVPAAIAPEEAAIYELHVRDFSIRDQSTPANHRGKYLAFTDASAEPVKHLKALADSGLTHVHLLPMFDGSSIIENMADQINLDSYVFELCAKVSPANSAWFCTGAEAEKPNVTIRSLVEKYSSDSDKQRRFLNAMKDLDGFNWNYDPEHFNAPDGSYATDANGAARILETRAMNLALHNMGLRVVYDMVYPHMAAAGTKTANATFDKIVPGYYFRQNIVSGTVETGTGAGPDTATEHVMMAKFVKDSLVQWATAYKVDAFRFDQAGYMPKSLQVDALNTLKAINPSVYFYGEAWVPFGGTSGDRITTRATQKAMAGTGIGTFNDVARNPLRQFNIVNGGSLDAVRAGLAGNLSDFRLKTKTGSTIKASNIGAYNLDPQESVIYADVHDESALWDWMQKPGVLPADTTVENRVRIQDLTLSIPLLSQGVPFIHAGSEILRSKSMVSNSYNSGDWFNFIDFTMQSNNWAVGLPTESDVADDAVKTAFANPNTKPTPTLIKKSSDVFSEFLKISKSSPLFSLTTAADVIDRVGFHDGGVTQKDNLIIMSIDDGQGKVAGTSNDRLDLDPKVDAILVVFNGSSTAVTQQVLTSTGFVLHSVQANSTDSVVRSATFTEGTGGGSVTVPAYTTAVFVKPQSGAQGVGLSATATTGQAEPAPYGDTKIYVRGNVSDSGWGADSGNQMTYNGKGIYSAIIDVKEAGSKIFKIAESNWSNPNLGSSTAMSVGQSITLTQGSNDNISLAVATPGVYKFQLDASQSTTAPVISVTVPVYVRGTVSTTGWGANDINEMQYDGNGVHSLVLSMAKGSYEFKVASSNWSTVNVGASSAITLGDSLLVSQGGSNIGLTIPSDGMYRFEFNNSNPSAPFVRVFPNDPYKDTPIYLRGTVSSAEWGASAVNQLVYRGGVYQLTLNLNAGEYQFKVAESGWSNPNLGGGPVTIGVPLVMTQGGGNMALSIATSGSYVFKVDAAKADAVQVTVDQK